MKIAILFLMCFISFAVFGQQEAVDFSLEAPENVVAGNEFEVTLTFKKGDLKDYSRFSQDLPSGFTATNVISPNADFTFADQRIRIIWLKLPDEKEIQVKYAVDVHERLSGKLELTGTFAYVHEGERSYMNLSEPVVVKILPNPDIDQDLVVDIGEFHTIGASENIDDLASLNTAQQEEFLKTGAVPKDLEDVGKVLADKKEAEVKKSVKESEKESARSLVTVRDIDNEKSVGSTTSVKTSGPTVIDIAALEAVSGVSFRVQIAAVRNPYFTNVVFAGHDLLRDVKIEKINGWNKYTVGPLTSYEEANRLKNRINNETVVESAFVVGYQDGKRVPVDTLR